MQFNFLLFVHNSMHKLVASAAIAALLFLSTTWVGCNSSTTTTEAKPAASHDGHDHDENGHDHDENGHDHDENGHDHDENGHDHGHEHGHHHHPAHGPNGGHMVELNSGISTEWASNDEKETLTVYPFDAEKVTKVEMKTTIAEDETAYEFEKKDVDGSTVYELTSPALLTAIKMGEAVKTKLVLQTADGEMTGDVEYHSH